MSTFIPDRVAHLRARGFVVVPAFVDPPMQTTLRHVCDAPLDRVRARSSTTGHSTPRISVLDAHEAIGRFFASPAVCALLEGLALAGEPAVPVLRDVHYYHEQTARDFDGDWHRDSQLGGADLDAERAIVARTTTVHVRVALEDDDCLAIVPGSHARWDTPEELRIRKGADRASGAMPHAERITLRARDACIFHAWAIHRATYRREPLRRTLDAVYAFTETRTFAAR